MEEALSDWGKKKRQDKINKMYEDEYRLYKLAKELSKGMYNTDAMQKEFESLRSYVSIVNVG